MALKTGPNPEMCFKMNIDRPGQVLICNKMVHVALPFFCSGMFECGL